MGMSLKLGNRPEDEANYTLDIAYNIMTILFLNSRKPNLVPRVCMQLLGTRLSLHCHMEGDYVKINIYFVGFQFILL